MTFSSRVAARYQAKLEDDTYKVIDQWADLFLNELGKTKITEKGISKLLKSQGVSPEDVNSLDGGRQGSNLVRALGGLVKKSLWYLVVRPFLVVGKLINSGKFRNQAKASFLQELRHDVRATRHMFRVARKIANGEPVKPQEKKAAMAQFVNVMTRSIMIVLASPQIASLFSGSAWVVLRSLTAPIQEMLLVLLYRPLQRAAEKLLTAPMH